eukprot:781857-Pelagomonas_calceolata.AAC.1
MSSWEDHHALHVRLHGNPPTCGSAKIFSAVRQLLRGKVATVVNGGGDPKGHHHRLRALRILCASSATNRPYPDSSPTCAYTHCKYT